MSDNLSARHVSVHTLPLISTVNEACDAFGSSADNITPTKALFFGKIPALLFLARLGNPLSKANDAINECLNGGLVTDDSVRELMSSFLTGRANEVMKPLLQLMDTHQDEQVRWIPYHMTLVLEKLTLSTTPCSISTPRKDILQLIYELLGSIHSTKPKDGVVMKRLFVIVLLIRILLNRWSPQYFQPGHVE
jgi:hypothetical protein